MGSIKEDFLYLGMLARSQLAIMDFNEGSNLEQATTEKGEKRHITCYFPKLPKAGLRNQSKKKKLDVICIVWKKEIVECVNRKERPEKPLVCDLPKNIASIPKPDKTVVIENQRLRFGN